MHNQICHCNTATRRIGEYTMTKTITVKINDEHQIKLEKLKNNFPVKGLNTSDVLRHLIEQAVLCEEGK